jgi:hypothetical protein
LYVMDDITDTVHLWQRYAVSGRYGRRVLGPGVGSITELRTVLRDTVRLDVDGSYPTMTASGTLHSGYLSYFGAVDWASYPLVETGPGVWECDFVRMWGSAEVLPPNCAVRIAVQGSQLALLAPEMTITFSAPGFRLTRTLTFESGYFREAELEVDVVEGAHRVTAIDTCAHANRPAGLRCEQLWIDTVYRRAGVDISRTQNTAPVVPLACAQEDRTWSDQELHDAMRMFWSRYKHRAQWAFWILYAGLHERNSDTLRGTMFDFTGIYQRQGCAAFTDVWEGLVPPSYPQRAAHIARMRFFSAVHESGHCFNLAHSFQKAGDAFDKDHYPWWPLFNEPDALSFMNYPERVGVETFFSGFEYRFSDRDLRFIRHAPERLVMMGEAKAGENYGYLAERAAMEANRWALDAAPAHRRTTLEFLEPLTLQLTLTNISDRPQVIDAHILQDAHHLAVWIRRADGPTMRVRPYAVYCWIPVWRVLQPGESVSASTFVSAGIDRWYVAEPGRYEIFTTLAGHEVRAVSRPLHVRVAHPRSWDEEVLAQEVLSDEVGRALALGGTLTMTAAIRALEEAAHCLQGRPAALHAMLTLALPRLARRKVLQFPAGHDAPMSSVGAEGGGLAIINPQPREARQLLDAALLQDSALALRTFGPDAFREHLQRYIAWLERNDEELSARKARDVLAQMSADDVRGPSPQDATIGMESSDRQGDNKSG